MQTLLVLASETCWMFLACTYTNIPSTTLAQWLRFYIFSGSGIFMLAICVNDTYMFLFWFTDEFRHNNTACRLAMLFCFCLFFPSCRTVSPECLCFRERRWGDESGGYNVALNILRCLIHETQSSPWVTVTGTLTALHTSTWVGLVCVQPMIIESFTQSSN